MQDCTLAEIEQIIKDHYFIVIDKCLIALYPQVAVALKEKCVYELSSPEKQKNINDYAEICDFFLSAKITRNDTLLAIGGGATSDLTGFVAATILRGIKWRCIPTTLLAMVDAAIGGKTGINTARGKNLVGAFHFPENIYICHDFLSTLSSDDYQSGLGEITKYCLIEPEIFNDLTKAKLTQEVIKKCGELKQRIVADDSHEKGLRKILNLGHTFGHAFEKGLNLPHGIAVAMGIKLELSIFSPDVFNSYCPLLAEMGLKLPQEKIEWDLFCHYMKMDKKRTSSDSIELIIVKHIGEVQIKEFQLDEIMNRLKQSELYVDFFC